MSTATPTVDLRLRELRATRQRCAATLRMTLAGLPLTVSLQDRAEALALEQQVITAALEALMTPPVPLGPAMDRVEREQWHAAMASLKEESELPRRERNKSVVPRKPAPAPVPEPEPIPAAEPEPELTGWRAARRRRLMAGPDSTDAPVAAAWSLPPR